MKTIGFIGLGLIGGSIAKTIRKFHPDYHILAYAKHKETLAAALNCNAIDAVLEEKDERYHTCDYIFLCAPVEYNIEYLKYLMTVSSQMQEVSKDQSIKLLKNLVWITVLLADIRWPDLNSPDLSILQIICAVCCLFTHSFILLHLYCFLLYRLLRFLLSTRSKPQATYTYACCHYSFLKSLI